MLIHRRRFVSRLVALAILLAFSVHARGQFKILQTPYNDLVTQINMKCAKVFLNADTRKAEEADLVKDINRLNSMTPQQGNMTNSPQFNGMQGQMTKRYDRLRLALEDPAAAAENAKAISAGGPEAVTARFNKAAAAWLDAGQNEDGQTAALAEFHKAADATGQNVDQSSWEDLLNFNPPVTAMVGMDLMAYLKTLAAGPGGGAWLARHEADVTKLRLEGHAIVIEGSLVSGDHFSTADLKGKVILIQVWDSQTKGSGADMLHIEKIVAPHRADGLEAVGISCDTAAAPLKAYLAKHPEVKYPQMYDPAHHDFSRDVSPHLGLHIYGVRLIIDRKGIAHYVGGTTKELLATIDTLMAEAP